MTDYRFVTVWRIEAPIDRVFDELHHPERGPEWWRGVDAVERLSEGDENGIGGTRRYTWKSKPPYRLVFDMTTTRVERPHRLEGRASGELEGMGRWVLTETATGTEVRYTWEVRTTRRWMNLLAPLARPFFEQDHDVVMRWGAEGLGKLLGARVIHVREGTRRGATASDPA